MAAPSLRTYRQAWELKRAGLDWRQVVLDRVLTGTALAVARLKADPTFTTEAARVRAFVQAGAGCRASYFRHAQKLRPPASTPQISLLQTTPPADAGPNANHFGQLLRRFRRLGNG
jgi:hypothetical protein